jgi:hypothetical protein
MRFSEQNVSVISGYVFQVTHADFFPLPEIKAVGYLYRPVVREGQPPSSFSASPPYRNFVP